MTVAELRKLLAEYPAEAIVYVSRNDGDDIDEVTDVTPSEHAPNDEVYLEC
jgi:hypothetical protein